MTTLTVTSGVIGAVARLQGMTTTQLRQAFVKVMGETPRSNNRSYLFKRLALKVQEPGRAQALECGITGTQQPAASAAGMIRDPRLPQVGAILTKTYKGRDLKVLVAADGFEFEGTRYRSLSAIARKVTGTPWNGFLFFGLIPTATVSA